MKKSEFKDSFLSRVQVDVNSLAHQLKCPAAYILPDASPHPNLPQWGKE